MLGAMVAVAGLAIAGGLAQAAGESRPTALRRLEMGQWELRPRPANAPVRRLCINDAWQLMQIEPAQASCRRFVVADAPDEVAATFNCAQAGSARTDLRVENARLVQIRSQGVARGAPFELSLEGRRVGACP